MSGIHIFDRDHVLQCDIPFKDMIADKLEQILQYGSATYQFTIPSNYADGQLIDNEFFIVLKAPEPEKGWLEFKAKEIDGDAIGSTREFIATLSATTDLNDDFLRPVTYTDKSAKDMLSSVLLDTGWSVGHVDASGVSTLSIKDYPTKLSAVQQIKDQFGLDLRFRTEYSGNDVTGRYVDLLTQRGNNNGKEFDYTRDIQGLKRKKKSGTLYTGVIPLGKTDNDGVYLNIKSVSRSTANGDAYDKPQGQDYIINQDAVNIWGKKFGLYKNTDISDATTLSDQGWNWLQKQITTQLTYEVDPILLGQIAGYEQEAVSIGDTVGIKDKSFVPEILLDARIVKLDRSFVDPSQGKATLGDYIPVVPTTISQIQKIQSTLDQTSGIANGKTRYIRSDTEPTDTSVIWIDTTQTPNIEKTYDTSSSTWVKSTPTKADEIAETSTLKYASESGADVTGNHTANDVKVGTGKAVAESGADKTSNNTAKDTSNVNGIPSTHVSGWAFTGNTAYIDGGNLYAKTVNTEALNVDDLSAISANLGKVTAGEIIGLNISGSTVTGSDIKSLSLNSDVEITDGYILNTQDLSNPTASPRTYLQNGYVLARDTGSNRYAQYQYNVIIYDDLNTTPEDFKIQSSAGINLTSNGGDITLSPTTGIVHITSKLLVGDTDFRLGADDTTRGDTGASRALVKNTGAKLVVNYGGDFTGGTEVQGNGLGTPWIDFTQTGTVPGNTDGRMWYGAGFNGRGLYINVNGTWKYATLN